MMMDPNPSLGKASGQLDLKTCSLDPYESEIHKEREIEIDIKNRLKNGQRWYLIISNHIYLHLSCLILPPFEMEIKWLWIRYANLFRWEMMMMMIDDEWTIERLMNFT